MNTASQRKGVAYVSKPQGGRSIAQGSICTYPHNSFSRFGCPFLLDVYHDQAEQPYLVHIVRDTEKKFQNAVIGIILNAEA